MKKKTGEISKIVGISKRALQFYDTEGLIDLRRTDNNYRMYDEADLEKLWMIMIYKEMGFELKEIKLLLESSDEEKLQYYKNYISKLNKAVDQLDKKKRFVSMIIEQGIPELPDKDSGISYKSRIEELRENTNL